MIQYGAYQWVPNGATQMRNHQFQTFTSQSLAIVLGKALKHHLVHFSVSAKKDTKGDISTESESKEHNLSSLPLSIVEEAQQKAKQLEKRVENGENEELEKIIETPQLGK